MLCSVCAVVLFEFLLHFEMKLRCRGFVFFCFLVTTCSSCSLRLYCFNCIASWLVPAHAHAHAHALAPVLQKKIYQASARSLMSFAACCTLEAEQHTADSQEDALSKIYVHRDVLKANITRSCKARAFVSVSALLTLKPTVHARRTRYNPTNSRNAH